MKTIIVATGVSLAVIASAPISAASLSYNRPLTNACYEAAAIKKSPQGIDQCNAAIASEATTDGSERTASLVNRGILYLLDDKTTNAGRDFDEALASTRSSPKPCSARRSSNGSRAMAPARSSWRPDRCNTVPNGRRWPTDPRPCKRTARAAQGGLRSTCKWRVDRAELGRARRAAPALRVVRH